jgi:hypothetical protein
MDTRPAGQASPVLLSCRFRLRPLSRRKRAQNCRPLPRQVAVRQHPDSPAFHFAPLRSVAVGTVASRSPTAAALPQSAGHDASLTLR